MKNIRLTEEEKLERRETIIGAAFQLFCDKRIEAVPLSAIAKKAKVSENTLYRYFGGKEKLVLEAFIKLWDTIMHSFRAPCLKALEKGKKDGSIPVKENSEGLFYAIWNSIRGYVIKIVIYGNLYGEDSPWESRYNVMEKGILTALSSGWNPP